jgi:hypothetical protein
VRQLARRLEGYEVESAVHQAGRAVRGITLDMVAMAIAQAVLAGIRFAVVGDPTCTSSEHLRKSAAVNKRGNEASGLLQAIAC